MLTFIEGTYENGQVVLNHPPEIPIKNKVVVIFEEASPEIPQPKAKRPFGISKGAFTLSPDFDEPLEDLKGYM